MGLVDDSEGFFLFFDFLEDGVYFFEWLVCSFWEEEVYGWDDDGIDDGENCVCVVVNVFKGNRSNYDDFEFKLVSLFW